MTRPTLTITECCEVLRANGVSVDNKGLAAAIEAGRIQWAVSMNAPSAKLHPKIFKHKLARWIEEMTGHPPVAIEPEWLHAVAMC